MSVSNPATCGASSCQLYGIFYILAAVYDGSEHTDLCEVEDSTNKSNKRCIELMGLDLEGSGQGKL